MACLYRRMERLHIHSLMCHVFASVVSCCLACSFYLLQCPSPMVLCPPVRALVLDYCNSLFASSSTLTVKRLPRVQDAAVRLLCNAPPRARASPLRK